MIFLSKKQKKTKKEKKVEPFDLDKALANVNPLLREGLHKYIIINNIDVANEKEFNDLLNKYGGF